MKVCKFGGTSMATADTLRKVKNIIDGDKQRKYVVVSAPGKRFKGDTKVTDLLYKAYSEKGTPALSLTLSEINARFSQIVNDLGIKLDINPYIKEIEDGINNSNTPDYAASRGEFLSGIVMAKFLNFEFVDAGDIIKFRVDGSYDAESTNDLVGGLMSKKKGVVIPGFYGRMPDKSIKTFSRGGSDVTGAIIANGVEALVYENWTDVNGFLVTDPTVVPNPKKIDVLTYAELRELSYMGASVLHPDSIFPLKDVGIPINIRNTFEPENEGTMIVKTAKDSAKSGAVITGIAGKKGNSSINITKAMMNNEIGFGRKILSVLERNGVGFEHIPTGIDTMSIILTDSLKKCDGQKLIDDIRLKVDPDTIDITHDIALIAVVGNAMANTIGVAARVFTALYHADVNVKMIDQGSSEINIIIGVAEKDYDKTIGAIYYEFFA